MPLCCTPQPRPSLSLLHLLQSSPPSLSNPPPPISLRHCRPTSKMPSLPSSFIFFFFLLLPISHSLPCNHTCGHLQPILPFFIGDSSCGSPEFQLTCVNATALYLTVETQLYRVLEFYSDGILVDFPGLSGVCRPYNDLNSFGFAGNRYFAISGDNVVGLHDCEDSSLCKASCEGGDFPGCGGAENDGPSCCYPLSDRSVWRIGDGFPVFGKYECRGFSCWAVQRGVKEGKRGVKLEWGLPENVAAGVCHGDARTVNATAVKGGVRCVCGEGFAGDGFANGTGCVKSCMKDGKEAYGKDCEIKKHETKRKIIVLVGLLTSILAILSLCAFLCLLKQSYRKPSTNNTLKAHFKTTSSLKNPSKGTLFTLAELDQATKGFSVDRKLADLTNGSLYSGSLSDGSRIAVHRLRCQTEKERAHVLAQTELLSTVPHRHVARILGYCTDSRYLPAIVYEFPENGTLAQHLRDGTTENRNTETTLEWYKRLTIAAQTACTLAYLQHEMSTPIHHHNLKTPCIFLDHDFSLKLAGFELVDPNDPQKSDVCDFGLVLLEIVSGQKGSPSPTIAVQKIRDGKLEEIVDPLLYFHEQPGFRKEQIEIVADVAMRCLLFGGAGEQASLRRLGMVDVARELVHVAKESINGGSKRGAGLEETFSNSSLLQMISVSPDSIYAP